MRSDQKIHYIHLRYAPTEYEDDNSPFSNFGGVTLAYLLEPHGDKKVHLSIALTICSQHDNFCRKKGREIAMHRLLNFAPSWTFQQELSATEAVQLKVADILYYAYAQWPEELETWSDVDDEFELEPHEKTMSPMCCSV